MTLESNNNKKKLDDETLKKILFPKSEHPDNWAGAFKEFFKQLGAVLSLIILCLFIGQACGFTDIYRLLGK